MRSILSAALLCTALGAPVAAQPLEAYLPKSHVIAGQVMELGADAEQTRIAEKMQRAIQKDAAWLKSYAAKAAPGRPLPYHARLGITKAEYDVLLKSKMSLIDKGPVSIKLTDGADGSLAFSADGLASALNGVTVSPQQKSAATPYGKLANVSEVSQDDAESATGPWKGVQWKKNDALPAVTLALGRRQAGDGILYYNVAAAGNNPGQTLIVIYRLD